MVGHLDQLGTGPVIPGIQRRTLGGTAGAIGILGGDGVQLASLGLESVAHKNPLSGL